MVESLSDAIFLAFAAVGVLLMHYGWGYLHRAEESRTWPTVEGWVVDARVGMVSRSPDGGMNPYVEYVYEIDGREYQGNRAAFTFSFTNADDLPDAVAFRYVPGQPVSIHVNPQDPGDAVLQPGRARPTWLPLILGLGLFLLGSWVWLGLWLAR